MGNAVGYNQSFPDSRDREEGWADSPIRQWAEGHQVSQPPSRSTPIVTALREGIITGELRAGQQLKQDELSAHFGVSPAPVREALRQLENEGLVRHYPNRGSFVIDVPAEEVLGVLLPTRLVLEEYAWKQVRARLGSPVESLLEEQIQAMERGADVQDMSTINEADVRFHEIAMEASGAHHTIQLWRSVLPRIRLQMYRLTPHHRDLHEVPAEHRILLEALCEDDFANFGGVLYEHIVGVATGLLERANLPQHSSEATGARRSGE